MERYQKIKAGDRVRVDAALYKEVREKLDGSQFGFTKVAGVDLPVCRSKGAVLQRNNMNKMFTLGVAEVDRRAAKLHDGWEYYGEYFQKPRQNKLTYNKVPEGTVALWAIKNDKGEWLTDEELQEEAYLLGFGVAQLLARGYNITEETIKAAMEQESCLGLPEGQKVEGVVLVQFSPDRTHTQPSKYVSKEFKEVMNVKVSDKASKTENLQALKESLRTEARYDKARQNLASQETLRYAMQDIGKLVGEVKKDLAEEETEYIKDRLFDIYGNDVINYAAGGVADWWKNYLGKLESS